MAITQAIKAHPRRSPFSNFEFSPNLDVSDARVGRPGRPARPRQRPQRIPRHRTHPDHPRTTGDYARFLNIAKNGRGCTRGFRISRGDILLGGTRRGNMGLKSETTRHQNNAPICFDLAGGPTSLHTEPAKSPVFFSLAASPLLADCCYPSFLQLRRVPPPRQLALLVPYVRVQHKPPRVRVRVRVMGSG